MRGSAMLHESVTSAHTLRASTSQYPILSPLDGPVGGDRVEDRINYFERMLADNPDNPTGLLALANE